MDQSAENQQPYELVILPLVVDKLGVKLYDKASAVVSELIANSYDADAEEVIVRIPLGSALATKQDGTIVDAGYIIEVEDNGHGMTPGEAQSFYLEVGRNRRVFEEQGGKTRDKKRPVMGRKGIGKLAPFGICKRIEVISAGGEKTAQGFQVTHFHLDYDKIMAMDSGVQKVQLETGNLDRTFDEKSGTKIKLSDFQHKVVPKAETFYRQLAARFVFAEPDFEIRVEDTRLDNPEEPKTLEQSDVPVDPETRIDLKHRPVVTDDGEQLPVTGWLAKARTSYQYEELAGVRIYARNKIVAMTKDFEQPAGFTGEFTIRSYLVGEIFAEWLDFDDGEDLIRSDRQGILWESDYGRALRKWGAELIKEIGRKSSGPRRRSARDEFLRISNFEERARNRYPQQEVSEAAIDLAKKIGAFANEDELKNEEYVEELADVILAVAPHKALIQAFQDFGRKVDSGDVSMDNLLELFGKTRVAEMASYSQIAAQRVKSIRELEKIVTEASDSESTFQNLLARSPWLIEPTWTVLTENQALKTFKTTFESFWKQRTGEDLVLAIGYERKRPDFTLANIGQMLHIVEIKKAQHPFDDHDCGRLLNYIEAFRDFFTENADFKSQFSRGWRVDLIADRENLNNSANKIAYDALIRSNELERRSWNDFLLRATTAHEQFLKINEEFERNRYFVEEVTE